jgi:hypothetical protein
VCTKNPNDTKKIANDPRIYVTLALGGAIHLIVITVLIANAMRIPFICPSQKILGIQCPLCGLTETAEEIVTSPALIFDSSYWDELILLGLFFLPGVTLIWWLIFGKLLNRISATAILCLSASAMLIRTFFVYY